MQVAHDIHDTRIQNQTIKEHKTSKCHLCEYESIGEENMDEINTLRNLSGGMKVRNRIISVKNVKRNLRIFL